jgi:hypothetical protein
LLIGRDEQNVRTGSHAIVSIILSDAMLRRGRSGL